MTFPRGDKAWPGSSSYICLTFKLDVYLRFCRLHVYMTLKHALVSNCQLYVHVNFSRLLELGSLDA